MEPGTGFGDRAAVVWVWPRGPRAVAAGSAGLALAGLVVWVLAGGLPAPVADGLVVLAAVVGLRTRAAFTDPDDCTGAGISVLGVGWSIAVACGVIVSVQRSTWAWGAPVAWWVHILVGLGIVGFAGAVSWATVLACFLVSEDAAFLGAGWGVLVGTVAGFSALWLGGVGVWTGMLCAGVSALAAGPALTALLRVRLVPPGATDDGPSAVDVDWDALLR